MVFSQNVFVTLLLIFMALTSPTLSNSQPGLSSSEPGYPMVMGLVTIDWLSAEEFESFSS